MLLKILSLCLVTTFTVDAQSGDEYDYQPIQEEEEGSGSPENIMSIVGVFEFTAKPEWQTMTSQDYPNPYPNDASFAWQVEAEQETDVIVLQLSEIYLGLGDRMVVYDGENFMDPSVRVYHGVLSQYHSTDFVLSTTDNMYVTLESDSTDVAEGFSFNVQSIKKDAVPMFRLLATPVMQALTSPGYPEDATPVQVTYVINTQDLDSRIVLILNHVHLSPGDLLTVHDGFSRDQPLREFTDHTHLHHSTDFVMSQSPRIDVHASFSSTGADKRFKIQFYTIEKEEMPVFELVAVEDTRSLTSPNYPLYYPRDLAACWVIQSAGFTDLILLKFRDIALDREDMLSIHDGSDLDDTVIKQITGPFSVQNSTELVLSSANVLFVSSKAMAVRGGGTFHLDYSLVHQGDTIIVPVLLRNESLFITSPNYPETSPTGVTVLWEIEVDSINDTVILQIEDLYLNIGDEVTIYENKSQHSPFDVHYTNGGNYREFVGSLIMKNSTDFVRSHDSDLYVAMETVSERDKGMKMLLTSISQWEQPVFELTALSAEQHLTSPNYPNPYRGEIRVTWIIKALFTDSAVILKLVNIQLTSGGFLQIHNGAPDEPEFDLLRTITGPCDFRQSSDFLLSFSSSLSVVFESHSLEGAMGFNLVYSEVEESLAVVSLAARSDPQVLLMPHYEVSVEQTIEVTWHITAAEKRDTIALLVPYNLLHADDKINIYDNSLLKSYLGSEMSAIAAANQSDYIMAPSGEFHIQSQLSTQAPNQKRFYYYSVPNDMTPLFAVSAITQAQELTSPDFPLNYPPDFHASWIINTLYSNQQVILHLRDIHLSAGDTVTVYDGFDERKQILQEFTGPISFQSHTDYLRSRCSEMFISFMVTSTKPDQGYKFLYNSVARDEFYEQEVKATPAVEVLSFPEYPDTYQTNTKSSWTLSTDQPGRIVVLHLTHVHLSQGDYIYIYDGPDNSSDLMLSLTGHSHTKEPVESTGQSLHVRLDSQWDSTQDEGFEMVYYMANPANLSVDLDPCLLDPCPVTHVCERLMDTYACVCPPHFVGARCIFRCDLTPADVAFLLDSSRSISAANWAKVVEFVSTLVQTLDVRHDIHRIGVLSFAANATIDIYFDDFINNTEAIITTLEELPYKDSMTNIAGAIRLMKEKLFRLSHGDREGVKNIAVLITDGEATVEKEMTRVEANRAKFDENVLTFAVAIGSNVNMEELYNFVSKPVTKYLFRVEDYSSLSTVEESILTAACSQDVSVLKGVDGSSGDQGHPGDTGHTGEIGTGGETGTKGTPGYQGEYGQSVQGSEGSPGATGEVGTIGSIGATGDKGGAGMRGASGVTGNMGVPGISRPGSVGMIGGTGSTGELGVPGHIGTIGNQGQAGTGGVQGMRGLPGHIGVPGYPGMRGIPGEKGVDGSTGPVGPPGHPQELDSFKDENQCEGNSSLCEGTCVDLLHGYRCDCPKGLELNEDQRTCHDTDECLIENGGCEQLCKNSQGSYKCYCGRGFTLSLDTVTCLDVDECCSGTIIPVCRASEICVNTFGGYACLSSRIAFYPVKKGDKTNDFLKNKFGDVLMSRPFFIGMIVWLMVLTLVSVVLFCLLLWGDGEDIMDILRDRLLAEEDLHRNSHDRFRRMTSQEAHSEYIFPRLSLRGEVEPDNTDSGMSRKSLVSRSALDRRKSIMKKTLAEEKSFYQDPYRRKSLVTIQSPSGHVTSVTDPR